MKDASLLRTPLRSLRLIPVTAALGLSLGAGACSLLVEQRAVQCERDNDCAKFTDAICSKENVCVSKTAAKCSTHKECIERLGDDYICAAPDSECKTLKSNECQTIVGAPASDDALIIGSIAPTTGVDQGIGLPIENGIRVALGDFKKASGELGVKTRPLVLVGCDDKSSLDTGVVAATHLVSLGAPAIIGAAFSGITVGVKDVTVSAGTLLISPSATAVGIGSLVDNSLVWRTVPPDTYQAKAISLYVDTNLKPKVGTVPALKVAVLHRGDPYGTDLSKAFESDLILNGQRPTDPSNESNYLRFDYGDPDDPANHPPKLVEAISATLELAPHIIVLAGFSEAVTDLFVPIEKDWPTMTPRPFYVMTDGVVGDALRDNIGQNENLRLRVTGTTPGRARSNPLFQAFASNYNTRFSDGGAEVFGTAEAYDATYLIAYAAASIGDQPVTGPKLAQALGKMVPPGMPINVGVEAMPQALELIRAGQPIDFTGASGPLDFDLGKGEAAGDIQIWCLPEGLDGRAQSAALSGLYLDAANEAALQGKLGAVCF